MSVDLVGFKDTKFIIQGWDVSARPGKFVEVNIRLIASVFGNKDVDIEAIASALTASLNNQEVRKVVNKQFEVELEAERVIRL